MRNTEPRRSSWVALILGLGLLAYLPSFDGVFVFDDLQWIVDNDDLHRLWPPWAAARGTLRPLLFFTLAINHAISGLAPWSYHLVNLGIHLTTALLLFGSLRRLLRTWHSSSHRHGQGSVEQSIAGATALLWAVHPLTTQAVTYVIQRGESLASLLYVLCFYGLLRSIDSNRHRLWWGVIVLSWWGAMATKLIAVTLPVLLFAFDWLLLSGGFAHLWQRRRSLYLALGVPVLIGVVILLFMAPHLLAAQVRGDAEAFGRLDYLITQPGVILHYLRLVVWPRPLLIDHGWPVSSWALALVPLALLSSALVAILIGLIRRRAWSFVGLWFAGILAPTSSWVPLRDMLVEHRMYLPLVAPLFVLVWLGATLPARGRLWALAALVGSLALMTAARNQDYHSELSLFASAAHETSNTRRFYNLQLEFVFDEGGVLDGPLLCALETGPALRPVARRIQQADTDGALRDLEGIRTVSAANLRGLAFWLRGQRQEAASQWTQAQNLPTARVNLAIASWLGGDPGRAEQLLVNPPDPTLPEAHYNLGALWAAQGKLAEARVLLQQALALRPNWAEALNNLGAIAEANGEMAEAGQRYEDAIALEHPTSTLNRGLLHIRQRHYREALPLLDQVIRKSGGEHPRASSARSVARYFTGELYEAVEDLRKARRLGGATAALDNNLGCLNLALGDLRQARSLFEQALAKDPQQTAANHNLGKLLVIVGQPGPAVAHLQRAADRRPDDKVLAANLREARRLASR